MRQGFGDLFILCVLSSAFNHLWSYSYCSSWKYRCNDRGLGTMKKLFEKHENLICILLIVLYVVINSYCMQNFGLEDYRSTIINTVFSVVLLALIICIDRISYYGLTKVTDWKKYLYFIPLLLIILHNIMGGIHINNTPAEIVFHILTMINIGFLEEIIFR